MPASVNTNHQSGQSLIEVIVAIAVGTIVVAALTFASISSLRNAQLSKNQAQATKLAQEGIERVKIGRDRNSAISGIPTSTVISWNGNGTASTDIWSYQISSGSGCGAPPNSCYFNVSGSGSLTYMTSATSFPTSSAETVGNFKRAVILSEQPTAPFNVEKTVTVVITWTDFSGTHESRQTTYLRSI